MTIHEQITALLNGEMTDAAQVSELMHVLAVSPEKRDLLVEQVRMSRAFATVGAAIAPSAAADAGILGGLAAIDAEFAASAPPASTPSTVKPVPSPGYAGVWSRLLTPIAGVLLLAGGLGLGYLLAAAGTSRSEEVMERQIEDASLLTASLRDSLRDERLRLATLAQQQTLLRATTDSLREAASAAPRIREVVRYVRVAPQGVVNGSNDAPTQPAATPQVPHDPSVVAFARELQPAPIKVPHVLIERQAQPAAVQPASSSDSPIQADLDSQTGPWQIGLRNNIRLSLPRVYGLIDRQSVLTDREIYGTYDAGSLVSGLKFGGAVGQTRVALVIHSNTGGMPVDTLSELTPELGYARGFVASEIASGPAWNTSIELGGGGTKIGPFGTVGLNVEWQPLRQFSLQAGASSWLLLTDYQGRTHTSINLNAHYGVAFRF